jgi:hypothetical protein
MRIRIWAAPAHWRAMASKLTLAAVAIASSMAFVGQGSAQVVQETYTGTIASGTDALGYFGPAGADLTGQSFTATFLFDTSLGAAVNAVYPPCASPYTCAGGGLQEIYGGTSYGAVPTPNLSTTLTIGNGTYSYAGANNSYLYAYANASMACNGCYTWFSQAQALSVGANILPNVIPYLTLYANSSDKSLPFPSSISQPFSVINLNQPGQPSAYGTFAFDYSPVNIVFSPSTVALAHASASDCGICGLVSDFTTPGSQYARIFDFTTSSTLDLYYWLSDPAFHFTIDAVGPSTFEDIVYSNGFLEFGPGTWNITVTLVDPPCSTCIGAIEFEPFGISPPADPLTNAGVPGPLAGAGLPGLAFLGIGFLVWWRRKRTTSTAYGVT